jgi:membrane associated rhomboid family serine protease
VAREPILNLPGVVSALLATFFVIHLGVELFPESLGIYLLDRFAFVPARLSALIAPARTLRALAALNAEELTSVFEGARTAWVTPLSYAFLHANWTHLGVNAVSLAAFSSPVAKRLGAPRFLLFFCLASVGGAAAHYAAHSMDLEPVVGASAGISGAMAAISRFAFAPGEALSGGVSLERDEFVGGAQPLRTVLANPRAALFLGSWVLANYLFGALVPPEGSAGPIAWEAHIGGFVAGLLLYGWLAPSPKSSAQA